jgi:hypothetical protein
MSTIQKLTDDQTEQLSKFYNEMLNIRRSIEPINHDVAEKIITKFYNRIGLKNPKFLYFPSPKAIVDYRKLCGDESGLSDYFSGQQWIGWKAFCTFGEMIGVKYSKEDSELLAEWMQEAKNLHWWFPYEEYVLVSERPIRLTVNESGRLHNESVMAIEYSDGWGMWYLNGVRVPEKLVTTDSEQLDISFFSTEKNADVKAEFVRKFGVERMLHLGKKIDSYENYDANEHPYWHESQYELWDMKVLFEGLDYQPYVKMLNQTTGIWHVEAVSPQSRNLVQAIAERFGGKTMKIVNIA